MDIPKIFFEEFFRKHLHIMKLKQMNSEKLNINLNNTIKGNKKMYCGMNELLKNTHAFVYCNFNKDCLNFL